MRDAFSKIYRVEGVRGFYKGFGPSLVSLLLSGFLFTNIYEVMMDLQLKQIE